MSYEKAMKWNKKHPKGTKQVCIMHTNSGFTPSVAFLETYFEYREECMQKNIEPKSCEYYYNNQTECNNQLNN